MMTQQKNQSKLDGRERVPFDISADEIKKALMIGERSIYQLKNILGWTYGRTQFIISKLIDNGDVFFKEEMENGRSTKIISLKPFKNAPSKEVSRSNLQDLKDVCAIQNEIIKKFTAITAGDISEAMPGSVTVTPASCDVNVGKRIIKKIANDLDIDLISVIEKSRAFLENKSDEE